jgi:lysophospholipase L1-like esterase
MNEVVQLHQREKFSATPDQSEIQSLDVSLASKLLHLRLISQLRVIALGDSSVYGVGDFDAENAAVGPGWSGRFAHDVKAARFINLGKNGSRFRTVIKSQLPGALSMAPDIALICIGTNDVLRGDFSPKEIRIGAREIIDSLVAVGAVPIFLGIPDPIKTAPGPMSLKKILHRRVAIINEILKEECSSLGGVLVSTWDIPLATDKSMWHIDRMHPSAKGHQEISDLVRRAVGLPRRSRKKIPFGRTSVHRKDEFFWLATNGAKWFAKRSFDLVPALIWLMVSSKFDSLRQEEK